METLVVDTTAFIQGAQLHDVADNLVTCQEVVDEIRDKRQLRRLVALPYDLSVRAPSAEHVRHVTEFSKKTGDYPSLSATDIKVMALTYQLEAERNGTDHLRKVPVVARPVIDTDAPVNGGATQQVAGFYAPRHAQTGSDEDEDSEPEEVSEDDADGGWITPANIARAKKQIDSQLDDEAHASVACLTTDYAMQNVLKQMNLNVSTLDGRIIRHLRTYIRRCYACFKTTGQMTLRFCPNCGNDTLKKVAVTVSAEGAVRVHLNVKRPLTARGKKFSLPRIRGGKHPNNPILVADQPMADNKPTRLARTKNDPLDDDYIAGYSPFIMRDVTSRSAQLGIRPGGGEFKQWMKKNPNESRRKRK